MSDGEINLLKQLSTIEKAIRVRALWQPLSVSFVPELPSYILAYEYYPAAEEAALKAVLGEIEFRGRLPV